MEQANAAIEKDEFLSACALLVPRRRMAPKDPYVIQRRVSGHIQEQDARPDAGASECSDNLTRAETCLIQPIPKPSVYGVQFTSAYGS